MPTVKVKELRASLLRKGFKSWQSDHEMFVLYDRQCKKTCVRTKISHGETELGEPLIRCVQKEMKLTRAQLTDFVNCPLSLDAYYDILQDQGIL